MLFKPREIMRMSSQTVLVTGASSGIGAAICRLIAAPEVNILMHARGGDDGKNTEMIEKVAGDVRDKGANVEIMLCDLSHEGSASNLVRATCDRFGGLDKIVSNAGFADKTLLGDVSRDSLNRSLSAMTGAFFELATEAMHALQRSDCGRVVAISSFVAHKYSPSNLFPVTAAAKASVEALARTLAAQLGPFGVTVNCVAPGFTQKDTGTHRAISKAALQRAADSALTRRIAEPIDVAELVRFLLSPAARQITGQTIHVDGGLTIA